MEVSGGMINDMKMKKANVQHGDEYFHNIRPHIVQEHEKEILDNLLRYIKRDDILQHFLVRLVGECENIREVVDKVKANPKQIRALKSDLDCLVNAKKDQISIYDSKFHETLFRITDNDFYDWWLSQYKNLSYFLKNFWDKIEIGGQRHKELIDLHKDIYNAVQEKDKDAAVNAMREHFSFLLFMLLDTTYERP